MKLLNPITEHAMIAAFPAGCYPIIVKHLKSFRLDELKIVEHDDSSVTFQSSLPVEKLIELRYFTNVYLIASTLPAIPEALLKDRYFSLAMLKNGVAHRIDPAERTVLEQKIERELRLIPNTHLARNNFYLIQRSSDTRLFTIRLPKAKFKREDLLPGELRPELAHILCLAAGLKAKHVTLDMFAGFGAIPYEAVRGFGCRQVIAIDKQELSKRHSNPEIQWRTADAINLNFLPDNSIDRIITDPPWGVYDTAIDNLASLYVGALQEMARLLKPDGVAVILSSYKQLPQCLSQTTQLKLLGQWDVLVSGKKATIYKAQKGR